MKLIKWQLSKLLKKSKSPRLSRTDPLFIEMGNMGPVGFKRSYKAKRLILKIKTDGTILVTAPRGISLEMAIGFVKEKTQWVEKTLQKIAHENKNREEAAQKFVLINRNRAKEIIKSRVAVLAERFDFSYNRIFIKDQKTIWGSCSSKNNLNFNYKIASLPEPLMDYVILHELVHTRVKNHSHQFWDTLDKYIENSKSLRKELKNLQFIG